MEKFRITNNSLLKEPLLISSFQKWAEAQVAFNLASAKVPEDPKAKPGKTPVNSLEAKSFFLSVRLLKEFPLGIEPKQLELEVGETKELFVSCFPAAWTLEAAASSAAR